MVTQMALVKQWITEQKNMHEHLLSYIEEEICAGAGVEVGVTMLIMYGVHVQNYKTNTFLNLCVKVLGKEQL